MRKLSRLLVLAVFLLCFCAALTYQIPAVKQRVGYHFDTLQASIKYALNPPEKAVFKPVSQAAPDLQFTIPAWTQTPSATAVQTQPGPTALPSLTPTITPIPTPIPAQVLLKGIVHEYQAWNNCGPATLAMQLSFWGWKGDQRDSAAFTKPNPRDKNVMPWELADFVSEKTDLKILVRPAGNIQLLKSLIAAGFPVVVEKGFESVKFEGWMGHYEVVNGYDDATSLFTVQDSYLGPNLTIPYDQMDNNWRAFNHIYLVAYPVDREAQVLEVLGPFADETYSYQYAAQMAQDDSNHFQGRDLYFAWFNRGTSLVYLKDYAAAATAYDAAFANYAAIPEKERPWRMLWYQTGPYFAYFYSQRYQDVINLATTTLDAMNEPVLEESYYWRAMAKLKLGDNDNAIADFRTSLKSHPNFAPALQQLQTLGVKP